MIFIVPRGENMLLLGGLVEAGEWGLEIDLDNYAPIQEMLERCIDFLPALAGAQIDPEEPVRVGLRPFRKHNVRVEVELRTRIIHLFWPESLSSVHWSYGKASGSPIYESRREPDYAVVAVPCPSLAIVRT